MTKEGLLVVISAPSGTGKGTLLRLLEESSQRVRLSVSATTRRPRGNEVDGKSYFFKTVEEFKEMVSGDKLIEWVKYCDNYYGTPREHVENLIKEGYHVVLEVEVEGAMNIRKKYPRSVLIFVLPPSFNELEKRIRSRGTEGDDAIRKRLETAKREIDYISRYDYVIINHDVDKAVGDINCVLKAEGLKYSRNKDILTGIGGSF